ncbi:hypothetical protein CMQ_190 [Grosmannia clavigera kw1407]|uniref:Uncharacterized protein n=1 Tax=Grosmannia clavigera (strain kw1407 / UAMH 11150) TaxID=655863 RepID=F0XQS5_GROCL|nr:uncharacterized protein CMQ_190 [Grosmannia clavigera kw1407]EFW99872.1 hypothetical protein CMQ_190 [Grosmannia clavigera kw1407]
MLEGLPRRDRISRVTRYTLSRRNDVNIGTNKVRSSREQRCRAEEVADGLAKDEVGDELGVVEEKLGVMGMAIGAGLISAMPVEKSAGCVKIMVKTNKTDRKTRRAHPWNLVVS